MTDATPKPRFSTLSLEDLSNLPQPEWLIDGLLPADCFTTLFGPPGATKSFWALDAALSIAAGRKFHYREVKSGKVVYFVGEGLRGMRYRVEAWRAAHPDFDDAILTGNFLLVPQPVKLLEKYDQQKLLNTLAEEGDVRMIVIDTWARSLTGGDENSAGDAGVAIDVLEQARHLTGASPLVVHHTGADGTRERGSTALRGASDATLRMLRDDSSRLSVLSCLKMKDGEPFRPIVYRLSAFAQSVVLRENEDQTLPPALRGSGQSFQRYGPKAPF
jgi:hypothetical protein